jgi:hypothetical protein
MKFPAIGLIRLYAMEHLSTAEDMNKATKAIR